MFGLAPLWSFRAGLAVQDADRRLLVIARRGDELVQDLVFLLACRCVVTPANSVCELGTCRVRHLGVLTAVR